MAVVHTPSSAGKLTGQRQVLQLLTPFAGQYPAIDRVLARQQAISKVRGLSDSASITSGPKPDECLQAQAASKPPGPAAAPGLQLPKLQHLTTVHRNTKDGPSLMHNLPGTARPVCSRLDDSCGADASESAHDQYLCFKAWRQERHNAAVIIQKHARGLLARCLCVQTRRLDSHRKLIQHRMLSSCIQCWRCSTCASRRFR